MASIKVLHVVGAFPSTGRPHCQVFIKTQIDSLVAAGVVCDVLVLRGAGPFKYLTGWQQIRSRLRQGHYDLIHAHYAYCAFVSLNQVRPLVTSLLGSDLVGYPRADGSFPYLCRFLHRALSRFVAKKSDACIVKSQHMKNALGQDVNVVPNGVDLDCFYPVDEARRRELRQELGLSTGVLYVLFVGKPTLPRKRFSLAQAAVEEACRYNILPVKLLPLSGRSHRDVIKHMQACDMLLLTSSFEGSPNVVKEALAVNMAVVAVDVGDTRERLEGVSGCRVSKDDRPEAIGAAIADVFLSNEPRAGRQAVESLRMEAVAARITAIYERVLNARRNRC
jgi:glycosyltransferase involved in cell wall biosynthesis